MKRNVCINFLIRQPVYKLPSFKRRLLPELFKRTPVKGYFQWTSTEYPEQPYFFFACFQLLKYYLIRSKVKFIQFNYNFILLILQVKKAEIS